MFLKLTISCLILLLDTSWGACPTNWILWGDHCYLYHDVGYATSGMSWGDARLACQSYGGDLVIIGNNTEFQFLAKTQTPAQRRQHYWIGLTDKAKEGQWKWVDRTDVAATGSHWRTKYGEPNNWGGNEDCAEMHSADGLWNDNACFREFAFICEKHKDAKVPPQPTRAPIDPSLTKECKMKVVGFTYRGTKNTTRSGFSCQKWSAQKPHKHDYNKPEDNPHAGLVENYCRNPDLEPDGPWCYTTSPSKRWEYCDIEMCSRGPVSCEAGWNGFNGSCYMFVKSPETWFEARKDCQMRGGDLTTINTPQEQNFIANRAKLDRQSYWIGLTDKYSEGTFFWVDGTKLNDSISYWNQNEPSNDFGGEDCVELYSWYNSGKWNDNKCTAKRHYVCEKISGKSQCPEDWVGSDNMCYQINAHPEQKKTWLEARAACTSFEGGDLVSIHDVSVKKKLTQEMYKVFTKTGYFWIGLNDIDKEDAFVWSDKSSLDYFNWQLNEKKKNSNKTNCVKSELRTSNGFWVLGNCNSTADKNYYICGKKREYNRCHSPLGMENFEIADSQISASSFRSRTTPPSSGRRNAAKGLGLDGAWCAATNDKNQWFRIDLGEYYNVGFIGLQGHASVASYVSSFYIKFSPDGKRWSTYGYQPPTLYTTLPGNSNSDRLTGASTTLSPPIKARFLEIRPLSWTNAICMRVEVYGCPAVADSDSCGKGWVNNTALNTCYKFSMTKLPWAAARANCMLEDGDLLSVTSYDEYRFLLSQIARYRGKVYSFWSGLNDRDYKRVFQWSDGSPVSFVKWSSGYPSGRYYSTNCKITDQGTGYRGRENKTQSGLTCQKWSAQTPHKHDWNKPSDDSSLVENYCRNPDREPGGPWCYTTSPDRRWEYCYIEMCSARYGGYRQHFTFVRSVTRTSGEDRKNCAAYRTSYYFYDTYCYTQLPYICKRRLNKKNDVKEKFTGNWISTTDYYWPLDDEHDGEVVGTLTGNATGTFKLITSGVPRTYLDFDGSSNFVKIPGFARTCVSDPSLCANGLTYSFLTYINTTAASQNGRRYLIDILGTDRTSAVGSYVYLENSKLGVYLRSQFYSWHSLVSPPFDNWIHVAFTWNERYGLSIYLNGVKQVTDNSGTRTSSSVKRDRVSDLYLGKSASISTFAKFKMMSLAIWKKYLSADEVKDIYLAELGKCKPGWIPFGQYCYEFNTDGLTWTVAKTKCESKGAQLATVSTSIQQAFIGRVIGRDGINRDVYIGLNARRRQSYSTLFFSWVDGSPMLYSNWYPGAPRSSVWRREDVTVMKAGSAAWDDIRYYYSRGYLCQKKKDIFVAGGDSNNASKPSGPELTVNIARGKLTKQSSTSWGGLSYRAVDGNKNTQWTGGSCTHTNKDSKPWWRVDLASVQKVYKVKLVNRGDCCWGRLRQVEVKVGNVDNNPASNALCAYHAAALGKAETKDLKCTSPVMGRYVYVALRVQEELTLCEVEVYAIKEPKSIVIRQYSSTTVGCPFGTTLNITSALWGKAPTCAYKDVLSNVRRRCASTYSCSVLASTSYLGSHCTTRKELKLNYTCDKPKSTAGDGCSPYWSSHAGNDNCYKLYPLKKTWTQARSFCQKQGADLVSINSRSEELYLTSLLIDSFDLLNIWTGMTDMKIRGSYYWSDGSPVKYTNWFNGQPDDAARRGSCVKTSLHRGYRDMLSLVDDDCASKNAFICKKLKATATTAAPLTTTASSRSCLSGWFYFRGFCYQFSTTNATWIAARDICKRQRAVLASIHSFQENEAVFNFLTNATQNKVDSVWLGLQDKGIFRGQRWTDGTPVNFVRWDTAQPDSNLGQQACTVMNSNGFWRDTNCLVSRNYVCKAAVGKATVVPTTKKLTPPTTATTNLKYCPQGWVLSSTTGNCYHFSNSTYTATWFVARTYCQSKGGQLASVESAVEKDFLAPFLLSLRGKEAWIGLSDLRDESGWEWVDRKPVNYINWETGAPDDSFGMEDCVVMKNGGEWNDVYCGDPKPFICERQNKTVPTAKTVAPTAGPDRGFCDPGWSHYLGKCYQFNGNDKLSWFGARNACRDQMTDGKPGDLVAIHSNYEMAFVFSQVPGAQTRMWIGLNDLQQERKFRWSDQSRVTYTYWNTRQPDNYRSNEDCVEILPYYNQKGKWNDNTCSGKQGYICQKDASANKPVATTTDKPSIICPKGYFLYAQNCYGFKKELKTWDEARAACKKEHAVGELASVHDVYDAAFLFSRSFEFTTRIWIGLHRPANQTKFRWSNNNPYDFTNWYAYPRRRYTNLRSCVYVHYSKLNNGYWRDSNCTAKLPYVCKVNRGGDVVKPEHPGNCPTGWVKYDKHCYYIKNSYYGTKKWANAKQACLDYGANLVSIHSAAEQLFLYKKLAKGAKNAWIGLNDRQTEKHMVWSDGTPNDYQNWDYKEPNDNQGYENCAEMIYTHGKWNDVSCSSYKGYICKKELGCDEEFGVKNKSIIRDSQMTASSSLSNYFAPSARLGMRSAWCAGTLDNKQYIQIDLTVKKRLTRILLQGFRSDYVLSFYLLYSDDGNTWKTYMVEGTKRILPGNRNTYSTDGVTLTAPISARFIRINPLTWKNKICMRLELLGCSYVCNTPLGMESRTIQNSDITASSEVNTQNAYDARLRNPRGQAWCAKTQDATQWLQIKLSKEPVKISEVETQGAMIDGKNNVVTAYKIAVSDDGKVWSEYKTYQGEIRIFGGNSAADSAVSHALSIPVTGRYIRFYPLSWSGRICMRVEVFGCAYNCDGSIGVEKRVVIDKAITASSSMEKHAPSQARLNVGAFNVGSWCASSIDQQQYLEFDLGADTRITGIATQGFEGDVSKYVTDYRIQFSQDAKFWSSYEVGGVIQLFTGNADGRTVAKNKLSVPFHSRYVRINPRHWKQGICMRVEFYGCALAPIVYPTDAPTPKKKVFKGSMRFTEVAYNESFSDKNSDAFIRMANRIETAITKVYIENYSFKEGFESVQVSELKRGSVIASFIIIYLNADANATSPLKLAVAKGKLGEFTVDKASFEITDISGNSDKPTPAKSKTSPIVTKEGLSSGGKVALIVIFLLLLVAIVAFGLIYYFKRRRGMAQFEPKSFENVVYDGHNVHNIGNEN